MESVLLLGLLLAGIGLFAWQLASPVSKEDLTLARARYLDVPPALEAFDRSICKSAIVRGFTLRKACAVSDQELRQYRRRHKVA